MMKEDAPPPVPGMERDDGDPHNGASIYEAEALVLAMLRGNLPLPGPIPVERKTSAGAANLLAMALGYLTHRFISQDPAKLDAFDWNQVMRPIIAQIAADIDALKTQETKH